METTPSTLISSALIEDFYLLVKWPYVQDLMDYEWFRAECYLHQAFDDQPYLPLAYFVPIARILALKQPG